MIDLNCCKRLLPITLLVFASLISSATNACSASAGECYLVWEDSFDGPAVDTNKWEFMIGNGCSYGICGWGNNELQYYRSQNATVANGELTITAKQENFGGANYTSARLRTKDKGDWTFGRFEMRAKFPQFTSNNAAEGLWPAFWMLPTNSPYGGWARSGEIDIMEIVGFDRRRVHGTIHYHDDYPNNWSAGTSYLLPSNTPPTDWRVYAVEWEADQIRWYVDNVHYSTQTWWDSVGSPFPAPFDVDFHLLLNMAVGGQWPGPPDNNTVFPQQFVVDYVKVYQNTPPPQPSDPNVFDDMEHDDPFGNGYYEIVSPIGLASAETVTYDLPPSEGDSYSLSAAWTGFGASGYLGGLGRNYPMDIPVDSTSFSIWINPDAGQDYRLEINLQEDDSGDGSADDEFQYNCDISPSGPCAVAGGGWQRISIPLASFFDDNSTLNGGNGVLDALSTANGGNGQLTDIIITVITNTTADASFRSDYWAFLDDVDSDAIDAAVDNCTMVANADQLDSDGDGHGNLCDADFDNSCGTVNIGDLFGLKVVFGTVSPAMDLNGSGGTINVLDLFAFSTMFGQNPGPSAEGALCP